MMAKPQYPSDKQDQYMVRFPEGMRDRVRQSAETLGRSMNAEIVQRLARSFRDEDAERLKLDLPADLWNSLMTDAAVNQTTMEERAVHILSGAFDPASDYVLALNDAREAIGENVSLSEEMASLRGKLDNDFLLYYSKVAQLSQFVNFVLEAARDTLPPRLRRTAEDLEALSKAEMDTLRDRHNDAIFKKSLIERSRQLGEDIAENS